MTYALESLSSEHPSWEEENIIHLHHLYQRDRWDALKVEVLFEAPCMKCRHEMGTHIFRMGRWVCVEDRKLFGG